ncbi:hypothetical protein INR49_007506 [Caranx melampygus]|nr:hypothetical protein INR49_007506 [Caranx melampygus]
MEQMTGLVSDVDEQNQRLRGQGVIGSMDWMSLVRLVWAFVLAAGQIFRRSVSMFPRQEDGQVDTLT